MSARQSAENDALVLIRERIRQALIATPTTDANDTYHDGYSAGLATALGVIDGLAPDVRFIDPTRAKMPRPWTLAEADEWEAASQQDGAA